MTQDEWEAQVPAEITSDPLWRVQAYRLGLFICDLAWTTAEGCFASGALWALQTNSFEQQEISSNIAEGYSRNSGKERAHYYEYAEGSAREARDWYYKSRHVLGSKVTAHRLALATSIAKLTSKMTTSERRRRRKLTEE